MYVKWCGVVGKRTRKGEETEKVKWKAAKKRKKATKGEEKLLKIKK